MTQKKVHVGVRVRPALKRELVKREGVGLCYRSSLAFHPMYGVLLRTNGLEILFFFFFFFQHSFLSLAF